jgi:hypothetical protein
LVRIDFARCNETASGIVDRYGVHMHEWITGGNVTLPIGLAFFAFILHDRQEA